MIGYNGHISDPTLAGWDDWNIECDLDVFLEKDPIPAGWDDWSTEFVRDINDIQDSTHMGWDDWNETSTTEKNEDTTQPARVGMIETGCVPIPGQKIPDPAPAGWDDWNEVRLEN